jgi:hypothetical protein
MKKLYIPLIVLLAISFSIGGYSQSVLDPSDPVITYNPNNPPAQPAWGQIAKWVRTVRVGWNSNSYKAYIYKGTAFRLKFPKTYNPTANDGKNILCLFFFMAWEKRVLFMTMNTSYITEEMFLEMQ